MNLKNDIEIFDRLIARQTKYKKEGAITEKFTVLKFSGLLDKGKQLEIKLTLRVPTMHLKEFNKKLKLNEIQKKISVELSNSLQTTIESFEKGPLDFLPKQETPVEEDEE